MDKKTIKKVNVYPRRPIFFGKKEIRHEEKNIDMAVGDIFQCLLAMAKVEEVGSTGEVTPIELSDFYGQNWTQEVVQEQVKINAANGKGPSVVVDKQKSSTNNNTKETSDKTNTNTTDKNKETKTTTTDTTINKNTTDKK